MKNSGSNQNCAAWFESVERALCSDYFEEIDRHFARFIGRLDGGGNPSVQLAAALASQRRGRGDICLDLTAAAGAVLTWGDTASGESLTCPPFENWAADLRSSSVVGSPGAFTPLVLDAGGRLYLHRYWQYERDLAENIKARLDAPSRNLDGARLRDGLTRLFSPAPSGEVDWQKVAAVAALRKNLRVISGGPGTGKTRTVVLLLALLLEQTLEARPRIAVVAPTGKAAARLAESIKAVKAGLNCEDSIKAALPEEARTIHRLLGARAGSPYFRHDAAHPLAVDVVVVDEASMVDLALMAKLFAAIPREARVILIGDKDQLSSVEAGAVLGDLCLPSQVNQFTAEFRNEFHALTGETLPPEHVAASATDAFVQLRRNYRFGAQSGIHRLSEAVNAGDADGTVVLLRELDGTAGVTWRKLPEPNKLRAALSEQVSEGFRACLEAKDAATALRLLGEFRVLSALRRGPWGVERLNRLAEEILAEHGMISPLAGQPDYHGRPVLVTRNDYNLRLFNGDVGLILAAEDELRLRAVFPDVENTVRALAPQRLPEHETVFAMTVHKSQGSEFERVLIVLPDTESPVVTRELVYTALTRACSHAEIWSSEATLRRAVATPVRRASGLREAVWGKSAGGDQGRTEVEADL